MIERSRAYPKRQTGRVAQSVLWLLVLLNTAGMAYYVYMDYQQAHHIPNLIGIWKGDNLTISDEKGYRSRLKTIDITEQKDRRFRGTFTYADGTKHFFGVIYPDNITFTWVSTPSHGFVHGKIMSSGKVSACYVETFENATAGCATLLRK